MGFIVLVLLGVAVWVQQRCIVSISQERDRYQQNSDALLSDMKQWRMNSAMMAADVKTLRLTVEEFERYRAEDAAIIKRMGVKIKNLEAAARHELEVDVPINATVRDTVVIRDTLPVLLPRVEMLSPHIQMQGIIENNRLTGEIKIPVTLHQAVWIEYKRRWLFWKKVKAIHQTISCDNPYVEIRYSEFIRIE